MRTELRILPGSEEPLSSDAAVMEGRERRYLFDVGARPEMLRELLAHPRPTVIMLSHFHPDHLGNLPLLPEAELLLSPHTLRYTKRGQTVAEEKSWDDGMHFRLFPFPSAHAKGCLALELDGEAVLVGDAFCPTQKGGRTVYNVQALAGQLAILQASPAERILCGHRMDRPLPKAEVLRTLTMLYERRCPGDPWVEAENDFVF